MAAASMEADEANESGEMAGAAYGSKPLRLISNGSTEPQRPDMFSNSMLMVLVAVNFVIGCLSIASASYTWMKSRMFGLAGIVLSAVGLVLIGASLWASVGYGAHPTEAKPIDATAVRQLIEDSDAKTVAALKDSNKQLADQLQQSLKQLQDTQDRVFSDIQTQVLAIRTALTDRPASVPQPRTDAEISNALPKRKAKTR